VHSAEIVRRKFWGTLLLSIPTVVWSPMIQHWLGYQNLWWAAGYNILAIPSDRRSV
jgi:cation transport ATPase